VGTWTGWIACAAIAVAAAIPTLHRVALGRRASPLSHALRWHAGAGMLAVLFAFVHVGFAMGDLGDPAVVRAGNIAIFPALLATFLLVAHVGVGIRLLSPRLRERVRFRRTHALLATTIVVAALVHVVALLSSRDHQAKAAVTSSVPPSSSLDVLTLEAGDRK
jgi:hypothetical protein